MQEPVVHDVIFYSASGVVVEPGQPLVTGTTYYAELGGAATMWDSIQWKWDSSVIVSSFEYSSTNLPNVQAGERADFWGGLTPYATAAEGWHVETAITTAAVAGGSASTVMVHIGGGGQRRLRAKVIVGATGGKLRGIPHHKGA